MPVKVYDYLFLSEDYIETELWPVYKPLVQGVCRITFKDFLSQNRFNINKDSRIFQFVYEENKEVLGVALLINNFKITKSNLQWICTKKEFWKQGIASKILEKIESHDLKNNYTQLQLFSLSSADKFWEGKGFTFEKQKMIKKLKPLNKVIESTTYTSISKTKPLNPKNTI